MPSIKKMIKTFWGRLITGLVSTILSALLINFLLISLTNLSSETNSFLSISISIALGLFIEESLKTDKEKNLIYRIIYSSFFGVFSGLAVYILF
ncbi:MAG: hypothetical protein ACOCQE_01875 [Halanaerobium sp.]